jgi:hypothetical protein
VPLTIGDSRSGAAPEPLGTVPAVVSERADRSVSRMRLVLAVVALRLGRAGGPAFARSDVEPPDVEPPALEVDVGFVPSVASWPSAPADPDGAEPSAGGR